MPYRKNLHILTEWDRCPLPPPFLITGNQLLNTHPKYLIATGQLSGSSQSSSWPGNS